MTRLYISLLKTIPFVTIPHYIYDCSMTQAQAVLPTLAKAGCRKAYSQYMNSHRETTNGIEQVWNVSSRRAQLTFSLKKSMISWFTCAVAHVAYHLFPATADNLAFLHCAWCQQNLCHAFIYIMAEAMLITKTLSSFFPTLLQSQSMEPIAGLNAKPRISLSNTLSQ